MEAFAGYEMPIIYTTIKEEHKAVRNNVGVFDVTHMGEFVVEGEQALDLVQWISSNNASTLKINQAQYSCLPNATGGIVDDMLVYRLEEQKFLLVVNASNTEKDLNWINSQNTFKAEVTDISDTMGLLAIQGPKANEVLQKLTDVKLVDIEYYHFEVGKFAGIEDVIISATGYTGAGGFEVYFEEKHGETIWNAIFEAGKEHNIVPAGLAARDTLRLEMGYCLYGNDIDDTTSPLSAGLGWITKLKAKDFVGKDVLVKQKEEGIKEKLVGFVINGKGIARQGYLIVDAEGNEIGRVTSGTQSPTHGVALGMGYVKTAFSKKETTINIQIRKKTVEATVVNLPLKK
ncbi:UNVERIFIED_CONTAM: hypothetical protein GTU68_049490 [Idotea baltica]|nr:hypothetical protein [Idotea baltica]